MLVYRRSSSFNRMPLVAGVLINICIILKFDLVGVFSLHSHFATDDGYNLQVMK